MKTKKLLTRKIILNFLIIALLGIFIFSNDSKAQVSVQVSQESDDAEERDSDGLMDLGSSDLELVYDMDDDVDNDQYVGIRFQNIQIPIGATIQNAYIEFQADQTASVDPCNLTISGELALNPSTFAATASNISTRTQTSISVSWDPGTWSTVGDKYLTSDISSVAQEIIDQAGWASGNAMVFIIEGVGKREAESHDGTYAPRLVIDYVLPLPISVCEDFNAFSVGSNVGSDSDWFDGGGGPLVGASNGVAGSRGLANSGSIFTWIKYGFDWNDSELDAVVLQMDFETTSSGEFDDDRIGWMITNSSTSSSSIFGLQLDPGGGGLNIEGYWDGVTSDDKRPSIVTLTSLSANTWYRFKATITKLSGTSASIDVWFSELDGSGNPTGTAVIGSIANTALMGDDAPHSKYFTATTMWPAFKNHAGPVGDADNACVEVTKIVSAPPDAPSDLSATGVAYNQIDLAWTDNSSNEDDFEIERSTTGESGIYTFLTTVPANTVSFSDNGLDPQTVYCYRIRATNVIGNSVYSNTDCAATSAAPPTTIVFQEGSNGYSGTVDTYIYSDVGNATSNDDTDFGAQEFVQWDGDDNDGDKQHSLVRFENLFGSGANQIPAGANIISAKLEYFVYDVGTSTNVYEVLIDWSESVTYNSFGASPGPVSGTDHSSSVLTEAFGANPIDEFKEINVTSSLVAWSANPTQNHGWIFNPDVGTSGVEFRSSEFVAIPANRPKLTVTYGDAVPVPWVAFNDMNGVAGDNNASYVTKHDYDISNSALVDSVTGSSITATVTGSYNFYDAKTSNGGPCNAGTGAANIFGASGSEIVDLVRPIELDANTWYNTMTFNNLDPNEAYDITLTANRNNIDYQGARYSKVTIEGADTYTNASSSGVVVNSESSVSFSTGYNTVNGYVARWTNVSPGADGSFSIKSEWDDSQGSGSNNTKGYAMTAFRLEQTVAVPIKWLGNVSTDWNNNANWNSANLPQAASNIVVPASPAGGNFIESNSGAGAVCNDLTIESGAHLYLPANNSLTVNGTLTNNAGASGLVLKASSSGISGSLICNNGVEATVQNYYTDGRWHFISSPMSNAVSNVFLDIFLKTWHEDTYLWEYIVDTDFDLLPGTGYEIWTTIGNPTVDYLGGVLTTSNISPALTATDVNNNGTFTLIADGNEGWNFVGNPFSAAIDLGEPGNVFPGYTWTNLTHTVYLWNGVQYASYNPSTGSGVNGGSRYIPSMQSFFVKAIDFNPALTLPSSARVHSTQSNYKSTTEEKKNIKFTIEGNKYSDEMIVGTRDNATNNFDSHYDAYKLNGIAEAPQLYMIAPDGNMSVNILPDFSNKVIPVGLEVGVEGKYTLEADWSYLSNYEEFTVYLEDLINPVITKLSPGEKYIFKSLPGDDIHRFNLIINIPGDVYKLSISDEIRTREISIFSYDDIAYISSPEKVAANIHIYDMMGQLIEEQEFNGGLKSIKIPSAMGYYIVKVYNESDVVTEKVFIK